MKVIFHNDYMVLIIYYLLAFYLFIIAKIKLWQIINQKKTRGTAVK